MSNFQKYPYQNKRILRVVDADYTREMSKKRNFEKIKKYFDMSEKNDYTLDDQTWQDFDMDRVFQRLDKNYSSAGESALYTMLRNPLMDEEKLKERSKLINTFKENAKLRDCLMYIFLELSDDPKSCFLDMIENDLVINKFKYYAYTFFGKILPISIILLSIFVNVKYMLGLLLLSGVNMFINTNESNTIKSHGIFYLRKIIKCAKKMPQVHNKDISHYTDKTSSLVKKIKDIDRGTALIGFTNMWGGLFQPLSVAFLLEECAYYRISSKIKEQKETLMELYYTLGELEALISISSYQCNLNAEVVEPKFIKDVTLNIKEGVHPLIEEPVANSINIENQGIVLTGTNMSGKSTFLRMLGVNMILAQTFYFVLAKSYEAPLFNIVSSISPNDDLSKGKSFFMAEVESILRIIKALEKDVPVFCAIDEIFRGTNPIERISMSAEILTYLNNRKTISIVTTHDRELADLLKNNYNFYFFSENVSNKKGLSFDYKLKKGISQTRNAIKLLEYMHYPKEIVANAFKRAEKLDKQ